MRLVWDNAAEADREEIFAYIEQYNPRAALKLDALFEKTAAALAEVPFMGHASRTPGTRELVLRRYILYYEITEDAVRILRILHTARQRP